MVNGTRYTFDVYGLYNGLFVMADRQTGSVWTHYDGSVLTGPLAGTGVRLTIEPIVHTTWEAWLAEHPDTTVLDWYEAFADRYREVEPGRAGLGPQFQRTVLNWDDRLPENELVLGVNVGDSFRAYVLTDFAPGLTVVQDELGGVPLIVVLEPEARFGMAFLATLEGEPVDLRVEQGRLVDDTGTVWSREGRAIEGPRAGATLTYVTSFVTEWYGWAAYHPETSIYGR